MPDPQATDQSLWGYIITAVVAAIFGGGSHWAEKVNRTIKRRRSRGETGEHETINCEHHRVSDTAISGMAASVRKIEELAIRTDEKVESICERMEKRDEEATRMWQEISKNRSAIERMMGELNARSRRSDPFQE